MLSLQATTCCAKSWISKSRFSRRQKLNSQLPRKTDSRRASRLPARQFRRLALRSRLPKRGTKTSRPTSSASSLRGARARLKIEKLGPRPFTPSFVVGAVPDPSFFMCFRKKRSMRLRNAPTAYGYRSHRTTSPASYSSKTTFSTWTRSTVERLSLSSVMTCRSGNWLTSIPRLQSLAKRLVSLRKISIKCISNPEWAFVQGPPLRVRNLAEARRSKNERLYTPRYIGSSNQLERLPWIQHNVCPQPVTYSS